MRVARHDFLRLDLSGRIKPEQRTVQDAVRVPSRVSRTGVQNYTDSSGKVLREYRPPEEVFDPTSLKSFETAVVTVDHPPEMVSPANFRKYAIGHVIDPHPEAGKYVAADLVVHDADAIAAIDRGDLVECSVGYDCDLEMTSGTTPDGEAYDAIQRSISANHVALGGKDWARCGPACSIKTDGAHWHDVACSPGCDCAHCSKSDSSVLPRDIREGAIVLIGRTYGEREYLDSLTDAELLAFARGLNDCRARGGSRADFFDSHRYRQN